MSRAVRIALPIVALAALLAVWISVPPDPEIRVESRAPVEAAPELAPPRARDSVTSPRPESVEVQELNPARGQIEVRMLPPGLPVDGAFVPSEPTEWIDRGARRQRAPGTLPARPKIPAPPLPEE